MIRALIGEKQLQSQRFLEDGTRIPVTQIYVPANPVVSLKSGDKTGYWAVQLGFGTKKHPTKATLGHIKGAALDAAPRFLREVRFAQEDASVPKVGDMVKASDVFKPGDVVDVIGVSKGKGYAGVVKRYHFKGGPRTHGQSDRERAPGSIGQTTTPGRVYKGKRMAGRMGQDTVTLRNLQVVDVSEDSLLIEGLVPGGKKSIVVIKKVGENKKFSPLYKPQIQEDDKPRLQSPEAIASGGQAAATEAQKENETQKDFSASDSLSDSEVARETSEKKVEEEKKDAS